MYKFEERVNNILFENLIQIRTFVIESRFWSRFSHSVLHNKISPASDLCLGNDFICLKRRQQSP